MEGFGLREKKKALQKTAILQEMIKQLQTREINEISLESLCYNVNISKVTFFKYFKYKEQVLDYFVCRWLFERSYEIHCGRFQGEDGLLQVFRTVCEDKASGKKIMVSLVNYYSKLNEKPPAIEVSPYEYYLFNQRAYEEKVKPMSLCEVFIYYLSGIGNIKPEKYDMIVCQLIALMYGVPIQTHTMGLEDMYTFYEAGVKSIIGTAHTLDDSLY